MVKIKRGAAAAAAAAASSSSKQQQQQQAAAAAAMLTKIHDARYGVTGHNELMGSLLQ